MIKHFLDVSAILMFIIMIIAAIYQHKIAKCFKLHPLLVLSLILIIDILGIFFFYVMHQIFK